jgi:hypothetical protein
MTSVAEVLHELGYASTEAQVADALAVLLRPSQLDSGVELTAADQGYLRAHSGVSEPTGQQLTELDARSAALAAAQAAGTLSRTDVAERLAIDPSRVSHQTTAGDLYAYKLTRGRPVYPDWQFQGKQVIPHLREVLAAVPARTHPVALYTFMTTPDSALLVGDRPLSPRQWLDAGGAPEPVRELAQTLGELV